MVWFFKAIKLYGIIGNTPIAKKIVKRCGNYIRWYISNRLSTDPDLDKDELTLITKEDLPI